MTTESREFADRGPERGKGEGVFYGVSRGPKYDLIASWIGSGKRVLDVGCGTGAFSNRLAQAGNDVCGVEIDAAQAAVAETVIKVRQGEFVDLEFDEDFDIVLFGDVLEHMEHPERALNKAAGLAPETIVCVPNFELFAVRLLMLLGVRKMRTGILDATHVYSFTKPTIEHMLADCGWATVDHASPVPKRVPSVYAHLIRANARVFGYQFIYRCLRPADR